MTKSQKAEEISAQLYTSFYVQKQQQPCTLGMNEIFEGKRTMMGIERIII